MDFRLPEELIKFMRERGLLGDCDLPGLAGAAKTIADPTAPEHQATAMDQIDLAVRLHGVRTVILMNHTDCGAYGGKEAFTTGEQERKRHTVDLKKARGIILRRFPGVEVQTFLAVVGEAHAISIIEV